MVIKTNANHLKETFHPYGVSMIIQNVSFTKREIDVLACLIFGRSLKGISCFLNIHYKTLEVHVSSIRQKLGFSSRDHIVDALEKSSERDYLAHRYEQIQQSKRFQEILRRAKLSRSILKKGFIIFYTPQTKVVTHQLQKQLSLLSCPIILKLWSSPDKLETFPHLILTHEEAYQEENSVMIGKTELTENRFYYYVLLILQKYMTIENKAIEFFELPRSPIPLFFIKKNILWKRGRFWTLLFLMGFGGALLDHFIFLIVCKHLY